VVIATDGKTGTRVTRIPAGDRLGALRRGKSECACEKLGILRPIFLSLEAVDTRQGMRAFFSARKALLAAFETQLASLQPDAILTWGPDGEAGHPEHIVVGAAITELLLRRGEVEKYSLSFFASKREQVEDDPELSYVEPRYLDLQVRYADEDERKSLAAAHCYVTRTLPKRWSSS
jgi:LmbE family N-acetylglucosaminyl deacetylase